MGFIRNYFRERALRSFRSRRPTGLVPIGQVRSASVLLDAESPGFAECQAAVSEFFRSRGIKGQFFFLDLRPLGKKELLTTSITNTFLRKDLDMFGIPAREKLDRLAQDEPDLLLSLTDRDDFPVECIVCRSTARFKVGRRQLRGNPFDLVVSDNGEEKVSQLRAFNEIIRFFEKIQ